MRRLRRRGGRGGFTPSRSPRIFAGRWRSGCLGPAVEARHDHGRQVHRYLVAADEDQDRVGDLGGQRHEEERDVAVAALDRVAGDAGDPPADDLESEVDRDSEGQPESDGLGFGPEGRAECGHEPHDHHAEHDGAGPVGGAQALGITVGADQAVGGEAERDGRSDDRDQARGGSEDGGGVAKLGQRPEDGKDREREERGAEDQHAHRGRRIVAHERGEVRADGNRGRGEQEDEHEGQRERRCGASEDHGPIF